MRKGRISVKFADDLRNKARCGERCGCRERDREEDRFEERCDREEERFGERHKHRRRKREEERFEDRHERRRREREEERCEERHEHRRHEREEDRFEERHEHRRHEREEDRFEERHEHREHERETILECGHGTGSGPLPINRRCSEGRDKNRVFRPIVLATVVLETKRLIEPTVKIDFSSLISFRTSGDDFFLNIMFRLSKICHEEERIPLGTWTFEESQLDQRRKTRDNSDRSVQETESFCFTFCEENEDRDKHCRYIVEIIDIQSDDIDFAIVSNVALTALAVGHRRR